MKVSFFCNYFLLTEAQSLTYALVQSSLIKGVWSRGEPSHEREGSFKICISWLSLESRGVHVVQRMALLGKLSSLSCSGGDKYVMRVRRHSQNYSNYNKGRN